MSSGLVETYRTVLPHVSKKSIDLTVLCQNDGKGFWAIVAHCSEQLSSSLLSAVETCDTAHSSTTTRLDPKTERSVVVAFLRLVSYKEHLDPMLCPSGLEAALDSILPSTKVDFLLILSSVLQRVKHRNVASIVITSLLGCNRKYLGTLPSYADQWNSRIVTFAQRIMRLAELGRYERKQQDIMSAVEDAYRNVNRMKSFVTSCPFVIEHFRVQPLLDGCAVLADIITPALYHFVATSDKLVAKRFQLQGIVTEIHNATLDLAAVLLLYQYPNLRPEAITAAEQDIQQIIMAATNNSLSVLLQRGALSFREWFRSIHTVPVPSFSDVPAALRGSSAASAKLDASRLALLEAAMSECFLGALAGGPVTSAAWGDPKAAQVSDLFPDWPYDFVKSALASYQGDVEQLVNDALMNNLSPGLYDSLEIAKIAATTAAALRPPTTTAAPPPSAHVAGLTQPVGSFELFQSARARETSVAGTQLWGGTEGLDDEMKAAIRQLSDLLYEDEYDDAADQGGTVMDSFADEPSEAIPSHPGGDPTVGGGERTRRAMSPTSGPGSVGPGGGLMAPDSKRFQRRGNKHHR